MRQVNTVPGAFYDPAFICSTIGAAHYAETRRLIGPLAGRALRFADSALKRQ